MTELSEEAQGAIRKVEALLRLAAKNPNEAEAVAAAAKAQELLEKYNLDMAVIERRQGKDAKREDKSLKGGLYHYQRDLWEAVAKLNFCLYWNQYVCVNRDDIEKWRKLSWDARPPRPKHRYQFQHRIVGRIVNTTATRAMSEYLEQTIERLTRERVGDAGQFFTRWAISYREGMADRICEKIADRRRTALSAEKRRKMAEAKKAREEGRAGVSTTTALALTTFIDEETDANLDHVHGAGWSAQQAADRAEEAREEAEEEARYTAWAKANPEDAKILEEERRKQRRRASYGRASYRATKQQDSGGYYAGRDKGEEVSIEPQVNTGTQKRIARS